MKSIHALKVYLPILLLCFGCASQKKQLITPTNPFTIKVKSFKINGEGFYQTQEKDTLKNNRSLPVKLYDTYYLQLVVNELKEKMIQKRSWSIFYMKPKTELQLYF